MKTLYLRGVGLFRVRDHRGAPTSEFSKDVFYKLAANWMKIVIVDCPFRESWDDGRDGFMNALNAELTNVGHVSLMSVPKAACVTARDLTAWWKDFLHEQGVPLQHVANPREISYLNIGRFVKLPHGMVPDSLLVAGDTHAGLGVSPQFPPTLTDMVERRNVEGGW